jgi:hypothetical protein
MKKWKRRNKNRRTGGEERETKTNGEKLKTQTINWKSPEL